MSETGVAQNKRKLPTSTAFVSTGRARQRRKETCIHLEVSKVFPSATSCVPRGGDEYFQNKCTSAHLSLCTDTLTPLGGDRAPPTETSADSQKYETQNQIYPDTSRNYVRERQCTLYRCHALCSSWKPEIICQKSLHFLRQTNVFCKMQTSQIFWLFWQRQSVNNSANMCFHSQSGCKI